jgi:peptidoglycan/LPS O-acetylase OafA/YrhL
MPRHFYSLDILRGAGALTVVVSHWKYLMSRGQMLPPESTLPLNGLLWPLYSYGWAAVIMFFCLSGFVFFWLYSNSVSKKAVSAKQFSVARFSRLYPLHFVTLLAVACGQMALLHFRGTPLFNYNNGLPQFAGQLLLISGWGPWSSFNFPTWSITVEIILYVAFFVVCRFDLIRWWQVVIYIAAGEAFCIHHGEFQFLAQGFLGFFIGGLSYRIFMGLHALRLSILFYTSIIIVTAALWILVPLDMLRAGYPNTIDQSLAAKMIWRFTENEYVFLLFPFTIITLALWETRLGTLGKRIAFIGDLSYSTYLIHFPLQIAFTLGAVALGFSSDIFRSPFALALFFVVLIPLSLTSHNFFERPAQTWIRSKLDRRKGRAQ